MIKKGLQNRLDSAGIAFEAIPGLDSLFADDSPVNNPFHHISTKHKQANYYKEQFGLVPPQRITLGHSSRKRRHGTKHKELLKDDEMMYIPLLESLQQMLNHESILKQIQNGHQRNDGIIEDYCDGQLFRTHPLFSRDPTALQLMLYYDEVEIANPLGSKAGKHKLGVIYFTLGNISPMHRSQLNAIQLLAIATVPIIKKYGIDALLEPFMEDLQSLEQDAGHQFVIKETPTSLCGTIVFVSGDNLGSQLVGGYKEGSGANLKCRHCMGTSNDIKKKFCEKDFTLRTRAGHDHQCHNIERNPELSKSYGVSRKSILCNSRYFHVVDGLPGDAMHDILEGVLQYQCKELLKVFINVDKYFTLDQLNQRIKQFDYGYYNDGNKPSPISNQAFKSENNSLRQKAAQMWCLGKFLPLIIGSAVPEDDERWEHFQLLLEIIDIVFSPVTNVNTLGVLEGLIEEYLWKFTELYPDKSVIPKMHYLVHYPAHMYKFGPMVRTWCMRYEAKHRYFKRIAIHMGNFNNVAYTLAEHHQSQLCYTMNASENSRESKFLLKETTIGLGKQVLAGDLDYFNDLKQKERTITETDFLHEAKKVTVHGTEYRVGANVVFGIENGLPQFASIKKIVVLSPNNIYFLLSKLITIDFNSHFHSFQIRCPLNPNFMFLSQRDLQMYMPTHTTKPSFSVNGSALLHVVLRSAVLPYI